jgi:hypothetical protein
MFDNNGDFIVGNTTLETSYDVTVGDYGVPLPEVHSTSPMIYPMGVKVKTIINWIERGLHVDFVNQKDKENVMYFVLEYNSYSKSVNEKNNKMILKPAKRCQDTLMRSLNWNLKQEEQKAETTSKNPFISKIKFDHRAYDRSLAESSETSSTVLSRINKKKNPTKTIHLDNKRPTDVKLYDMYSNDAFMLVPDTTGTIIDNVELE